MVHAIYGTCHIWYMPYMLCNDMFNNNYTIVYTLCSTL